MGTNRRTSGRTGRLIPSVRPRLPRYEQRVTYSGGEGAHALPSIDARWDDGGDGRSGTVEIHCDARDFRGVATSTRLDPRTGSLVIIITPNTEPLPDSWQDDPPEGRR
jgi:hypothetical protein